MEPAIVGADRQAVTPSTHMDEDVYTSVKGTTA